MAGYGYPTGFFLPRSEGGKPVLIENDRFGWRFLGRALARSPYPVVLPAEKPTGAVRVFVLGESAAYGDPQPDFGLPRLLRAFLEARYPGTRFEVVNAAMTAINSHALLPIARDCAQQHGDVWVVYMGNNEVVGPFGSGTVFGSQVGPLPVIRASLAIKTTRTGELLADLADRLKGRNGGQTEWQGMKMFMGQQVRQDDPRMSRVYHHFERNLCDILAAGAAHGTKVVVSTVAVNLRDCAPFASLHRPDLLPEQREAWDRYYRAGLEAETNKQPAEAAAAFAKAAEIDEHFADLQFRWARACLALGHEVEAARHFAQARDEDTLRFRADTRINEIIRRQAQGREAEGVYFADGAAACATASPHGLTGEELLYEHVHLNFAGNYLLARTLAEQVAKALAGSLPPPTRPEWPSAAQCAQRLGWTDWNQSLATEDILLRINDLPFTTQLDHEARYRRLQTQMEQLAPGLRPPALREDVAAYRRALTGAPDDWVLHRNLCRLLQKLGDLAGAAEAQRRVVELLPQSAEARFQLGALLALLNRPAEAMAEFNATLRLKPDFVPARNGLGLALASERKFTEAIVEYEAALRLQPDSSETHLNLGMTLNALGRTGEAQEHFRRALSHRLNKASTMITLGKMAAAQGWKNEALTNLYQATRLAPGDPNAHFCLGAVLVTVGQSAEAQAHFAEAVRLDPEYAEARLGLGIELGRQQKDQEALEQFAAAVRYKPELVTARINLGIALLKQQRQGEALQQFEEALKLEPNNPIVLQKLRALRGGQPAPR